MRASKLVFVVGLMLIVSAIFVTVAEASPSSDDDQTLMGCFHDWSRCSEWSSMFTGYLWRSCNDRCIRDKGKAGGRCVRVPNSCRLRSRDATVLQCHCYD